MCRIGKISGQFIVFVFLVMTLAVSSQEKSVTLPESKPTEEETQQLLFRYLSEKKHAEAEKLLLTLIKTAPNSNNYYNLACVYSLLGKNNDAFAALDRSIVAGFLDVNHISADEDLKPLRPDPRFRAALAKAAALLEERLKNVKPQLIQNGVAMVEESNSVLDPRIQVYRVLHAFPLVYKPAPEIVTEKKFAAVGDQLRKWQVEGSAAGLHGLLYDNHDNDHSNMDYGAFPQLTRIEYGEEAQKKPGMTKGLQVMFLHNLPVIGNSSTAMVGTAYWRSNPRLAQINSAQMTVQSLHYLSNHLYFYPEHQDYDPGTNGQGGYGDVFLANTPYTITSQGSSGSDRVFMEAVALTIASFSPATQQKLIQAGILMPTVQMIFRASNRQVKSIDDYRTGKAHPPVFQGDEIDQTRMTEMAHRMKADEVPPVAILKVISEDEAKPDVDHFAGGMNERLFDTAAAVARIHRSTAYQRRFVISASGSKEIQGRPITYHWVVLRGDRAKIEIIPKKDDPSQVELKIGYHERAPISEGSKMLSNRVDIALFVNNGIYDSAPAFFSLYSLANETRVYTKELQIASVEYRSRTEGGDYVDPVVSATKSWKDEYHYTADHRLLGWTRTRGAAKEEFTRNGELVLKTDALGRPVKVCKVSYTTRQENKDSEHILEQVPGKEISTYRYTNDKDCMGELLAH